MNSTPTFSTNNYTEALIMEDKIHEESKDEKPYKESICVFTALVTGSLYYSRISITVG